VLIIAAASGGSRPGLPLRPVSWRRGCNLESPPRLLGDPDGAGFPEDTMLAGEEVAGPRPVSVTIANSSSSISWSSSSSSSLSGSDCPLRPADCEPTGGPIAEPDAEVPCAQEVPRTFARNLEYESPASGGGDSSSSSLSVDISGASMSCRGLG